MDAEGGTAYLNLEPTCEGGARSVRALTDAGVQRVIIGLCHPLPHFRNHAIQVRKKITPFTKRCQELKRRDIDVSILDHSVCEAPESLVQETLLHCIKCNEALLHRVATHKPFSVLKYAMTLDGKIASSAGHASWVSSPEARKQVFATRALSDCVIVGGNTVRRDNPNLTTRKESGFFPTRIIVSRTMDLPCDANLWNTSIAPTIVMTQRGARTEFQCELRDRGIEVIEFDFLSPRHVADYLYAKGFLRLLWECGGVLAAPAIAEGVIHKVMAFVSPKIIGGTRAPTPCSDLGFVEMTQAVPVVDMTMKQVLFEKLSQSTVVLRLVRM